MANYATNRTASTVPVRQLSYGVTAENFFYSVSTSISVGDTVQLFRVGAGGVVMALNVAATGNVNSYSLGDGDDSGRYKATATVATTVISTALAASFGYSYSAADTVDLKWDVSGAFAGTTIRGWALVAYDQQTST